MNPDIIIGGLAFMTIGLVIAMSVVHFGFFLRDPRNRSAAKTILQGGTAASTQAGLDLPGDTTLKERLDASTVSKHPYDPALRPPSVSRP